MMNLENLFGYQGKTVVVTGAASGMARATVELLLKLGAKVHAVDVNLVDLPVEASYQANLGDKDAIDGLVEQLPSDIYAFFSCHGIAQNLGTPLFVQLVNFYGQKYMTEALLPKMSDFGSITYISSAGGYGWEPHYLEIKTLIDIDDWNQAVSWYGNHEELYALPNAYGFSKQCITAYVASKAMDKRFTSRKIRINVLGPGSVETPLTVQFDKGASQTGNAQEGRALISSIFLEPWDGFLATPEQIAQPMVFLGSQMASYISGQEIYADYGLTSDWKQSGLLGQSTYPFG
ncbi:SDR family oxidoreductase [Streptococcus ruminantium]|uniref:SDR family oxidoreductase n=1 Tax=Streptococcus ruminantium TaxID=1917441 RepID=A0ABU1B575_9STRE|nr:SDR family oxidoreductase [Streptococcus ruminantium]MDQ8759862.1 SDR family oxidoreductase [Streptococcus ruminantium]MDQ8769177.1 SDR family oxidoreductase [Streptococcus ruminantium]MDQ8773828.1 SDR family oxidoreductase [Streptococcus ruminantium]MDQ8793547.1 SDR family oxidoreductase [Streptococcus ruminantium]MDQ8795059.1 SDR family oxidoreductase [Streptococcus ruminantium]